MNTHNSAVTVANDAVLKQMVRTAQRRLIVVAPGLSCETAKVIAQKWSELGAKNVNITLDVDPEVCRMGYGEIEAVSFLADAAARMHTTLNSHPGVRIGVVIADDETLIYAPTPLLVEAGPTDVPHADLKPNAIRVGLPPADLERDLGAGPEGLSTQIIGLDVADRRRIKEVEADLTNYPPQSFDISRLLRVYSSHIEFVEFQLIGCAIARKTISIPSDLFGLLDEKKRSLLDSKFRLVDDATVWGEELHRIKEFIARRYLVRVPDYGCIIRICEKAQFELAVKTLRKMVNRARDRQTERLQGAIDRRMNELENALLPLVKERTPQRWYPDLACYKPLELLRRDLNTLAWNAKELVTGVRVEVRYKGVTYETLKDSKFRYLTRKVMPHRCGLLREFDAVASHAAKP